jgi:hypothetical protein
MNVIGEEYYAEIVFLRLKKKVSAVELSKRMGYCRYYVTKRLKEGCVEMFLKAKEALEQF